MHTIFRIDGTITETPHAPILRELKDTKTKESAYFVALPATDSSSVLTRVTPIERLPNQWAEYGIESHPPRRGDGEGDEVDVLADEGFVVVGGDDGGAGTVGA